MGAFSDATKNSMLNAAAGRTTFTAYAGVYAKLHTGSPGSAGTSNPASHTTRVQATFGTGASAGSIATTADLAFTSLTAAETLTHVSFWDASSGGNFIGADDLPASKTVAIGDSLTVPSGQLTMSLTGTLP